MTKMPTDSEPMKSNTIPASRYLAFVIRHLPAAVSQTRLSFVISCCFLTACSRSPQTAAELYDRMPRRFAGEVRMQGETGTRTLVITPLDLQPRDAHLLEFKRIAYELSGANEAPLKGEAAITGTITAPGGEIHLEDTSGAGGGDAVKAGSFEGKLSGDLKSVDAKWKTGFDQSVGFQGKAAQ